MGGEYPQPGRTPTVPRHRPPVGTAATSEHRVESGESPVEAPDLDPPAPGTPAH
jgi:hypothetical protein